MSVKDEYYRWLNLRYNYSVKTKQSYSHMIRNIDLEHLEHYLLERRSIDKDSTFNLRITALRSFSRFLQEEYPGHELIPRIQRLKSIRSPQKQHHKPYSVKQVQQILNAAKGWRRAALHIALYAGLRQQEIQALDISDVDLENKILTVRKGKGGKYREVAMPRVLIEALTRWMHQRSLFRTEDPALLVSNRNSRVTLSSGAVLRNLSKKLGFRVSWHRCRATYATHLYRRSNDTKLVQGQLGHSSLATTDTYIHMLTDERVDRITRQGDIYNE